MPIYEYECQSCGNIFEEWHKKIDSDSTIFCPKCNQEAKRLISRTSFALKGEGWYVTEYGNKKKQSDESSSATASSSSEVKDKSTSEVKEKSTSEASSSNQSSAGTISTTSSTTEVKP